MSNSREPGNRAGLRADLVLEAAREIVTRKGSKPLTMRRLAEHLGVAPNTLYSHYPNKAALMDAVLDSLLGDIDIPDVESMDWDDGLVEIMSASRRMLLEHTDLLPLLFSKPMTGPNASRLGELSLGLLAQGGVTGDRAVLALRSLLTHTFGWVTLDAPRQDDPDIESRQASSYQAFSSHADSPMVAELAEPMSRRPADDDFGTSLRWLIRGIVANH